MPAFQEVVERPSFTEHMVMLDGPLVEVSGEDARVGGRCFDECKDGADVARDANVSVGPAPDFNFPNAAKTCQLLLLELEVVEGGDQFKARHIHIAKRTTR